MDFFYNLNKKMAELSTKTEQQTLAESKTAEAVAKSPLTKALDEASYSAKAARAGKDIGKPGKAFSKIAADAGKRYGSKAAGERVAGAVLNKLRHPKEDIENEGNAFTGALAKTPKGGKFKVGGKEFTDTSSLEEGHCPTCDCAPCKCDEGNAFTGALAKTPKGGKFKVGGKEFTDNSNLEELDMRLLKGAQGSMKGSNTDSESERNRHKKYGYRSDRDDTGNDDDYDEHGNLKNKKKAAVSDGPKKKGRPKKEKQPERVTAKSYKYKQGRPTKTKEDLDSDGVMMTRPSNMSSESVSPAEQGEYNDEAGMAKDSLHTIVRHAKELERALRSNENLPEWVQEKIGQIKGMMSSVTDYIISTHERDAEQHMGREGITLVPEKAVSQAQRKFMGMAHAIQKGEKIKGASPELNKVAKTMKPSDTHDFAVTKHKGLPKHVEEESTDKEDQRAERAGRKVAKDIEYDEGHKGKDDNRAERAGKRVTKDIEYDDKKDRKEKKVDETTVAGSVAPVQNAAPKGGKGMQFGKGVYESLDRQFRQALTEGMNVSVNMSTDEHGQPHKNITVSAEGEDAEALASLLKMAGLGGHGQYKNVCSSCGESDCGCQEIDENSPDWPTNTDTLAADPNLRTYSGGLNGPKSTGQSTTPVLASQLRRQASMEESVALERSLFKTWQNYKG